MEENKRKVGVRGEMRVLAIGGAVIKTALDELKIITKRKLFDILIHNGGSLFHDFQLATEVLPYKSHSLERLLKNPELDKQASELIWFWIRNNEFAYFWNRDSTEDRYLAPKGSVTRLCEDMKIPVMVFTVLGGDFWHLYGSPWNDDWIAFAKKTHRDFKNLCDLMKNYEFHYICMGSAVIHPEVFTKALAIAKPKKFKADVVDFTPNQYRPETRVAKYGKYYQMTHKEFLEKWIKADDGIDIFTGEKK
jgi:hypothetical protein